MTRLSATIALTTLCILLVPPALHGQSRDSLLVARRAYERADLESAVRLLPAAVAGAPTGDSLWTGGVHMLLDALLESGRDVEAGLWGRWAVRLHPLMRADSNLFPPRVARLLVAARRDVADAVLDSTAPGTTALAPDAEASPGRGALRLLRGGGADLAIVEGVGTMLPGEMRTMPPGSHRVTLAYGLARAVVTVDVLPGFVTSLTPRAPPATPRAAAPRADGAAAPAALVRGRALAGTGAATCAITPPGALTCWGDNRQGQLGRGTADSARGLQRVPADQPFAAVSVGLGHACALAHNAAAYCWGQGASGELGGGRPLARAGLQAVSGTQPFVAIAAGGAHTCALSATGAVFCWGANRDGALGNRSNSPSAAPAAVAMPPGTVFTAIAAGSTHSCALAVNGGAHCWGANEAGQLGTGTTSAANQPTPVLGPGAFRSISAGGTHTCALTMDGAAWCWGANASGQTGSGGAGTGPVTRPAAVVGGLTFATVESGEAHACGLTPDGAAYCWGAGRTGQLGNGQLVDSPRPVLVVGGHVFRTLALGVAHSCALTASRTVWCWGDNSAGQLGALGGRQSAVPVPVLVRPPLRPAAAAPPTALRETFGDGNFTAGPAWHADSAPGIRLGVRDGALEVSRADARGHVAGIGVSLPMRVPVRRETAIQFDVLVAGGPADCGLNCGEWPAVVRVRTRNSDLSEAEVWFAYGTGGDARGGGTSSALGNVVIVGHGGVPAGQWLRERRFVIRDYLPRADTVIQVSLGATGADLSARFDNVVLPVAAPAAVSVATDTVPALRPGTRALLTAAVRDSTGAPLPWVGLTWTSSDSLVARVDSVGVVTAARAGRAWIRASAGTLADSVLVTVAAPRPAPTRRPARPPR